MSYQYDYSSSALIHGKDLYVLAVLLRPAQVAYLVSFSKH